MLLLVWTSCCSKLFALDLILMSSADDRVILMLLFVVRGNMFLVLFVSFLLLHVLNEIMLLFCVFSTFFTTVMR